MPNLMTHSLPESLKQEYRVEIQRSISENRIARIWEKDASVWTGNDEAAWLGWLEIAAEGSSKLDEYIQLKQDIDAEGFTDVVLMGMGGSSLCPEVLARTFGKNNFHILDSTVPAQIITLQSKVNIEKTLFIVASKSGSTLEPNCFKQYFFDQVAAKAGKDKAGRQFIAITDPGSKMEQAAKDDGFRRILFGKPDIGGRFSALSAFGLAPAAIMGIDVGRFLTSASGMVNSCRATNPTVNPGAILGTILGICHRSGRDKLTILMPPEFYDLGAWLEQLVAESTGKNGVSVIPVDREPLQTADMYGNDRVFINYTLKGAEIDEDMLADLNDLEDAGHPIINIEMENEYGLAQEFFRWEFATAVLGAAMGINPFDQPDVESAKIEARKITEAFELSGSLPEEKPFLEENGISLFAEASYAEDLLEVVEDRSVSDIIEAHLWKLAENDYFAVLAYIESDEEYDAALQQIRLRVLEHYNVATCSGFGPRFLHSTGQAYKGGANNGVFLQITADDAVDLPVPGQRYTFGVVRSAQARGDFQVLMDRGRRALRVHLGKDIDGGLQKVLDSIL